MHAKTRNSPVNVIISVCTFIVFFLQVLLAFFVSTFLVALSFPPPASSIQWFGSTIYSDTVRSYLVLYLNKATATRKNSTSLLILTIRFYYAVDMCVCVCMRAQWFRFGINGKRNGIFNVFRAREINRIAHTAIFRWKWDGLKIKCGSGWEVQSER